MFNPYPVKADPVKIRLSKDVAKWFVICISNRLDLLLLNQNKMNVTVPSAKNYRAGGSIW